jgi:NitT/TauT family transport system substrate-binding protein
MITRRTLLQSAAVATAGTALAGRRARTAGNKISIMVGGIEKIIYLPAKLTEQLGYFKDEGLEVELLSEPAGVQAESELLSGSVQAVVGFYDHTVDLQSKGKFIETVVQLSQATGEVVLVASKLAGEIHSPADFKGRGLGVTGLGSSTSFLMQYLAVDKGGLKSGEFTLVPVGAGNTFIAAMNQGHIAAGMTTDPTVSRMLKTGDARVLIDMRTAEGTKQALGGVYPGASLYMESAWVAKNKPAVQKLANAFVKTLRYIATHSAEDIADKMPKDFYAGDKALYVKALEDGKAMFTTDGVMPQGGPETVLKVLSAFSPNLKGKTIDLSRTWTSEFVAKAA